jgi:hypothetical protein
MKSSFKSIVFMIALLPLALLVTACPDEDKVLQSNENKLKLTGDTFGEEFEISFSDEYTMALYNKDYKVTAVCLLKTDIVLQERLADVFVMIPIEMEPQTFDWRGSYYKPKILVDFLDNNIQQIEPDIFFDGFSGTTKLNKSGYDYYDIRGTFSGIMKNEEGDILHVDDGEFYTTYYFDPKVDNDVKTDKKILMYEYINKFNLTK